MKKGDRSFRSMTSLAEFLFHWEDGLEVALLDPCLLRRDGLEVMSLDPCLRRNDDKKRQG